MRGGIGVVLPDYAQGREEIFSESDKMLPARVVSKIKIGGITWR